MDVTTPIDFPGVFTSLPMSDLGGFDDIARITRALDLRLHVTGIEGTVVGGDLG